MRVKMLTNVAGTPSFHAGQIADLEDRVAAAWIKEGMAIADRDDKTEKAAKA